MKPRHYLVFLFAAVIFSTTLFGQNPTPTPADDDEEIIRVSSRLVMIPVSATDSNGLPILGLGTTDFEVVEDGRRQTVEAVTTADQVPLRIALLFDVSATTSPMFKFQQETAARFLRDVMRPDDRAAIFTIGSRSVMVTEFADVETATAGIASIRPTTEYTAFYDTVAAAADYLNRKSTENTRKVIVTISDGEDTNSIAIANAIQAGFRRAGQEINNLDSKKLREFTVKAKHDASLNERKKVLKRLQDGDTVFYSINPAGSSFHLNQMSVFGQENMRAFADETGGSAFLPKFQPIDTKDSYQNMANDRRNNEVLSGIFRQLSSELRSQYLVQYYSEGEFPNGRFVKLDVRVPTRNTARIRSRQGYYAKGD